MIFYKNLKKHRKVKQKNLTFSIFQNGVVTDKDDSVLMPTVCKNAYNVSFVDGALKTGLGFERFKVPADLDHLDENHTFNFEGKVDEIGHLWMDRWYNNNTNEYYYQLLFVDSENELYGIVVPDGYEGYIIPKSSKLVGKKIYFGRNYRIDNLDSSIFFTDKGMVYLTYSGEQVFANVPEIISCVVHYGNFFGITNKNRNTLVYTTNLNLTEWDSEQSSTIEFLDNRGAFTKLILFNDYVYLFREYGITKISLYSSKENFSFTHLYTSTSKIFENSVSVCGDVVLFATRDGLYKFNGNSVTKIFEQYDGYFKNCDHANCSATCLDGKYYLATKCRFDDDQMIGCENMKYINNVLFEFDIAKNNINILRGVDIRELLAFDTPFLRKLCACFYNENKRIVGELNFSGKTFENINKKCWQSVTSDLGEAGKRKRVREVILTSTYDCELEIESDEESKKIHIFGQKNEQRLQISVSGRHFKFVFETKDENIEIRKPTVVFDVVE